MKSGKRVDTLIECDVPRNIDFVGTKIKALVATVVGGITKEDTWCGACLEFVYSGGGKMRVA